MRSNEVTMPDAARCRAFWARENTDRPLLAAWVGSYEASGLYPRGLGRLPEGELAPADIDFELFRDDYEALFAAHSRAGGDVPWSAFPVMVVPWLEAVAGCRIEHWEGNVWAEPWLESYGQLGDSRRIVPREEWLTRLLDFTDWLVELSSGRFPVAAGLMRGPADILAAIRGAQTSVFDLMDDPRAVEPVLESITDLWVEAARAQLRRIPPFAGGYGWSIQNLWSEQPGCWFQDDAIAYWSPALYRAHAAPYETRLSECMPFTGCHLHSASIFTVEEMVKMPSLDVIEMNLDVVGKSIPEMIPAFQKILETKRLYVWGSFTENDLLAMKENLPTRGLALELMGDTPESVRAKIGRAEEIWLGR